MRFLLIILLIISCGKNELTSNTKFPGPDEDSDLDGVSNQEESKRGSDPFINQAFDFDHLGENKTRVEFRIRKKKDETMALDFLNLKDSKAHFYKKVLLEKLDFKSQNQIHSLEKDVLSKNVYSCITAMDLKALKVKHKSFWLKDIDIYTDLLKKNLYKKLKFYLYDFISMQQISFTSSNEVYKAQGIELDESILATGVCILYDNLEKIKPGQTDRVNMFIKLDYDSSNDELKVQKSLVTPNVYPRSFLLNKIGLANYININNVFYNKEIINHQKSFANSVRVSNRGSIYNVDVGDLVEVHNFISTKMNDYSSTGRHLVRSIKSMNCKKSDRRDSHFSNDFVDLDDIDKKDLILTVGNKKIIPNSIRNFHAVYRFKVESSMISADGLKISALTQTKKKYDHQYTFFMGWMKKELLRCTKKRSYNFLMTKALDHNFFVNWH